MTTPSPKRVAIYPGSFDPLTSGHVDIIERGARIFDSIIVAILVNVEKAPLFSETERVAIIREVFKDARIHFAINCAAKSCPPIRSEAFVGERLDAQLDEQARLFLNGPHGARFERDGDELTIHVTKIMDWFGDDFEKWAGGKAKFIRKYMPAGKQRMIDQAKEIDIEYDDYDWALNDWRR